MKKENKKNSRNEIMGYGDKRRSLVVGGVLLLVLIVLLLVVVFSLQKPSRSELYRDTSGGAGLDATIDYHCTASCDQKFAFNVYMFREDGQQVAVIRPDKDGKVQGAFPEGNYVMIIGRQFEGMKVFPQEPLALKNGKSLELKLRY